MSAMPNMKVPQSAWDETRFILDYDELRVGSTGVYPHPLPLMLCVGSTIAYVLLFLVCWYTPLPSAEQLATMKKLHNYALALFSGACCSFTAHWLITNGHTGVAPFMCAEFIGGGAELVTTIFALSKIWEWGDTVLLVWGQRLKNKPWVWTNKTVLHCFHHSTTFWLFLIVSNFPCAVKTGTLLNGGVHTVMYFYYADPAVFPKALTPLITQGQIAQLMTVTALWVITPFVCDAYATFPRDHFAEYITGQIFVPIYIAMFFSFYAKRFAKDEKKAN